MLFLQVIMERDFEKIVERLLETHCWVIDMLPKQVPQDSAGQFFAVEKYYMEEPRHGHLCRQFADVLLKLNCYYDLTVSRDNDDEWVSNLDPRTMEEWLTKCMQFGDFYALIEHENALITVSSGDTYMTLYNPSPALLDLVRQLSSAAGLFL